MKDTTTRRRTFPWVAAVCFVLAVSLLGLAGPVWREMLDDFGVTQPPITARVIMAFHWLWTIPAGIITAALLVIGSHRWPTRTVRWVCAVALAMALAIIAVLAASMFIRIEIGETVSQNKALHVIACYARKT